MPKVKPHRSNPSLDMTPMVDLAFLLVTFFMLISQFKPEEVVVVDTPSSISEIKLPESDIITISVDKDGRIFYGVDSQVTKRKVIEKMSAKYEVSFTENEMNKFANMASIGVPISQLKSLLQVPKDKLKSVNQPGVPADSMANELSDWVMQTRYSNPKVRIAIKGDSDADIPTIKKVIKTLQDIKVNKFNLITDLEMRPSNL